MTEPAVRQGPDRGRPKRPARAGRPVPVALGATTTGLWAAVVSLAPVGAVVLLGWVFGDGAVAPDTAGDPPDAGDGLRFAGSAWLLGHGVPLSTSAGRIGLVPLLVSVLAAWQLARAGTSTARAAGAVGVAGGVRAASAVAGVYGVAGLVVALLSSTPEVGTSPLLAGVVTGLFALVAAAIGAGRETGGWAHIAAALPPSVNRGIAAGAIAAALTLGGASVVVAGALVASWDEAGALFQSYGTGISPLLGLTALCLLYAPNAVVWAAAYAIGPGVSVGVGTSVTPWTSEVGPVPAFPLLAALPAGQPSALAGLLVAVPLVAGVIAGAVAAGGDDMETSGRAYGERRANRWGPAVGRALVAGVVGGVLLGFAALAAGGPLGDGRMALMGPSAWRVAAAAAAEIAVAALVGAVVRRGAGWVAARLFGPAITTPDLEPEPGVTDRG